MRLLPSFFQRRQEPAHDAKQRGWRMGMEDGAEDKIEDGEEGGSGACLCGMGMWDGDEQVGVLGGRTQSPRSANHDIRNAKKRSNSVNESNSASGTNVPAAVGAAVVYHAERSPQVTSPQVTSPQVRNPQVRS